MLNIRRQDERTIHVILTGATGLVGSAALTALADMGEITKISILSRRPVPMVQALKDDRIDVIVQENFGNYDSNLLKRLRGANGCVWVWVSAKMLCQKSIPLPFFYLSNPFESGKADKLSPGNTFGQLKL